MTCNVFQHHDGVIHHAAGRIEERAVSGTRTGQGQILGKGPLKRFQRVGAGNHEPGHMPDIEQSGVLVLPSDAPESLIVQTIRLLAAVRIQLEQMQHKTEKLEAKVADIRIINRAKLLLVQHLQMTETEAHKYIEKQAMDTSMRRRTIAENIIRTYED